MNVPDWAWKVLQTLVLPIFIWALATHVSLKQTEYRLTQLEQKVQSNDQALDGQEKALADTRKDIEIMKVQMDYVAKGIDEIKEMLKK